MFRPLLILEGCLILKFSLLGYKGKSYNLYAVRN